MGGSGRFLVAENPAQNSSKSRARSLYLYLRDNSGVKNKPQPLCRKGFKRDLLVNEFGANLLEVVALKATPATALTVRGVTTCRNSNW